MQDVERIAARFEGEAEVVTALGDLTIELSGQASPEIALLRVGDRSVRPSPYGGSAVGSRWVGNLKGCG